MQNVIRMQFYRIAFLYTFSLSLFVWQSHFFLSGIEANPYMNFGNIGVFLFGSFVGIRALAGLTNERVAFEALREAYGDTLKERQLREHDPLWRHHRCFEPAVVFAPP